MNELEMATAERTDLADFLATLTLDQWEAPSLCERWRVRDVVAHVMSFDGVNLLGLLRRAVRGRLIHLNQVGVDELASLSTEHYSTDCAFIFGHRDWPQPSGADSPCSMSPFITKTSVAR